MPSIPPHTAADPTPGEPNAELRAIVLCAVGSLRALRARLTRTVVPELRRRAVEHGVVFTAIDLQRGARRDANAQERLRRQWLAALRQTGAYGVVLIATDAAEASAMVRAAVEEALHADAAMVERLHVYACSERVGGAATERSEMRALRAWAGNLGLTLRDARSDEAAASRMVHDDLAALIDACRPGGDHGPLERERRAHEAFAASRRLGAAPRIGPMSWLVAHTGAGCAPVVIVGAPGSGRSTLVAQWAADYRRRAPDAFLLSHYVGVINAAESWHDVVARIVREVSVHAGSKEAVVDAGAEGLVGRDDLALLFAHVAAIGGTLVLDGVERLGDGALLDWVPAYLPPGLRLIVTTTEEPGFARSRGWSVMPLTGLTLTERRAFVEHFAPGRAGASARALIAADTSITTPLALRLRLQNAGGGRDEHADHASVGRGGGSTTLDDLMRAALERLEAEFSPASVCTLLTALWGARGGLTRSEALRAVGGASGFDFSELLAAIDFHLIAVDGKLRFHHDAFRRAVERRYLAAETDAAALHGRLAVLFGEWMREASARDERGPSYRGAMWEGPMRDDAMRGGVMRDRAIDRYAEETPWHLRLCGDRDGLRACISRADVMTVFVERGRSYELIELWNAAGGIDDLAEACRRAVAASASAPAAERAGTMAALGLLLRHAARYTDALAMLREAADLVEHECFEERGLRGAVAGNLADLLHTLGQLDEAERWSRVALTALEALHPEGHVDVAQAFGDLAELLLATGRREEGLELYRSALGMVESLDAASPYIATATNNLACALRDVGRYDEADALFRRALALWRTVGGVDHPDAAVTMNNLAELLVDRGEIAAANEFRGAVVAAWERMLGPDHPMVATALNNWASGIARDDPAGALPMLERALAIHDAAHAQPMHETAVILHTIGRAQFHAGMLDEAERNLRRAYDLQHDMLGADSVAAATTLAGLGMVMRERGDLLVAEQLLERALDVLRSALGERHISVGSVLGNLAEIAVRRNRRERARELALAALDILGPFEARSKVADLRRLLAELDAAS